MATNPLLFSDSMWLPAIPTYAVVMFFPERRSARSSAAAMELTVSSIFTTTPRRKPCEGQVPTPTIFSFPSRSNAPTRTQIFVVPTSIPTITRSCIFHTPYLGATRVRRTTGPCSFLALQCIHRPQSKTQINRCQIELLLLRKHQNLLEFNQPVVQRISITRTAQVRHPTTCILHHVRPTFTRSNCIRSNIAQRKISNPCHLW